MANWQAGAGRWKIILQPASSKTTNLMTPRVQENAEPSNHVFIAVWDDRKICNAFSDPADPCEWPALVPPSLLSLGINCFNFPISNVR